MKVDCSRKSGEGSVRCFCEPSRKDARALSEQWVLGRITCELCSDPVGVVFIAESVERSCQQLDRTAHCTRVGRALPVVAAEQIAMGVFLSIELLSDMLSLQRFADLRPDVLRGTSTASRARKLFLGAPVSTAELLEAGVLLEADRDRLQIEVVHVLGEQLHQLVVLLRVVIYERLEQLDRPSDPFHDGRGDPCHFWTDGGVGGTRDVGEIDDDTERPRAM